MENFICSAMSPIIAFVLAGLYITALAIDLREEGEEEDED